MPIQSPTAFAVQQVQTAFENGFGAGKAELTDAEILDLCAKGFAVAISLAATLDSIAESLRAMADADVKSLV